MKRLFLLVTIAFATALSVCAEPVDVSQALRIARTTLVGNAADGVRKAALSNTEMRVVLQDRLLAEPAWYVVSPVSGRGFVIVSGDDTEDVVLGYSTETSADEGSMPPALRDLLDNYSRHIALVRQGVITPTAKDDEDEDGQHGSRIPSSVTSLCKTEWDQSAPFNNLCPIIDGANCLVGCVALSMAQVMNYYKYPSAGTGTVTTYASGAQVPSLVLEDTPFDYDNMIRDYTGEYTDEQANAVATLCLACGYASKMNYSASWSGAYMEDQCSAMIKNFNYSSSTRIIVRTGALTNDTKWKKRLKEELAEGRPIIISAYTESDYGHNFICDGYSSLKFHINWGWGPTQNGIGYNGNYNILTLIPTGWGEGFTKWQQFLIGIKPAVEGEDTYTQYFVAANDSVADYSTDGTTVSLTLPAFTNATASNVKSTLSYIVADKDNNEVGQCDICSMNVSGKKDISSQSASFSVPSDLADGIYYLHLAFKPNLSDAFQKIESWYNKTNLRITLTDGQITDIKALTDDEMATDMTTGIVEVKVQMPKDESQKIYNIAGQMISNPQHGLYIKNGKKVVRF